MSGCRSCCSSCADPLAADLAYLRARGRAAQSEAMGAVVWPSEVASEKARIGGIARSVDATMAACYGAGDPKYIAWRALFASWTMFEAKEVPWFGSGGEYDLAQQYERQIAGFADQAKADGCRGVPSIKPRGDSDAERQEAITSAVKFAAVGVVAVAAVVALKSFL